MVREWSDLRQVTCSPARPHWAHASAEDDDAPTPTPPHTHADMHTHDAAAGAEVDEFARSEEADYMRAYGRFKNKFLSPAHSPLTPAAGAVGGGGGGCVRTLPADTHTHTDTRAQTGLSSQKQAERDREREREVDSSCSPALPATVAPTATATTGETYVYIKRALSICQKSPMYVSTTIGERRESERERGGARETDR